MEFKESLQYVDPEVTKIKFRRELDEFKENEKEFRKRGIICFQKNEFSLKLLFSVPHLKPQPIAFAINLDYTNWDVCPPSITFIDPFTDRKLEREEIGLKFYQIKDKNSIQVLPNGQLAELDLLQGGNGIPPIFCIPGVLEYHNHPAHSGDSWMLHRTRGEGKICVLINQIFSHSIAMTGGYSLHMEVKANVNGLNVDINKLKK